MVDEATILTHPNSPIMVAHPKVDEAVGRTEVQLRGGEIDTISTEGGVKKEEVTLTLDMAQTPITGETKKKAGNTLITYDVSVLYMKTINFHL